VVRVVHGSNNPRIDNTQALVGGSKRAINRQRCADLMAALLIQYPQTFSFAAPKPLKIGITRDLARRARKLIPASYILSHVLMKYTRRRAYKRALVAGAPRYDLNGNVVGKVTSKHAAHAAEDLKS
jgi:sRNA-binding protein